MKKTIAGKLVVRVTVVLAVAFMLLLAGAFFSLNREIKLKGEQYTKAIVGIFGDLIAYEASLNDRPVDLSFSDRISFYGDYMCSWYRVDCIYAFVPDFEKGTITYLSLTKNKRKYGDSLSDQSVGSTVNHIFTENEIRVWNDSTSFAVEKSDRFNKGTDVMLRISDTFGNKVFVGADIATDELRKEVMHRFLIVAAFMFIIVVILAAILYLFINRMVSQPARRISRVMSDYITGGKRSAIKLETTDDDEFSMMAKSFNHMTEEIDKYINDLDSLGREQERRQAEVDIASQIQQGILSPNNASLSNCGIKAVMKPAKDVGGDLYDYLEIDSTHTLLVVADVSGKGIPSAFLMSITLTLIRQYAKLGYSPAEILGNVNGTLSEENPAMMFVTAFIGIYDSGNSTFTYANAGHNPPYLIHHLPQILEGSDGTPLGLFADEEYTDVTVNMEEGDSVFLYTDGVNEAVNAGGEFYGTDRLEKVLAEAASSSRKHFVEDVDDSVRAFAGETEQSDDITMLSFIARKNPVLELGYDVSEFQMIRQRLFDSQLPKELIMNLCIAAEECFVNICSYAFDGPTPEGEKILFYFEYSNKVMMRFSDGGRPFDPRCYLPDTDEYDIDSAVGGLGRLIAFTIADSVDYEYRDGRNILTITKSIKKTASVLPDKEL